MRITWDGFGWGLKDGGTFVGESIAGVMFRPQRPQKRELLGSNVAHLGHGYVDIESPELIAVNEPLPHRPQKRTPSAKRTG